MWIGHSKEIQKLVFWTLDIRQSKSRNCGFCEGYTQNDSIMLLVGTW